jgi:hypothetical protein
MPVILHVSRHLLFLESMHILNLACAVKPLRNELQQDDKRAPGKRTVTILMHHNLQRRNVQERTEILFRTGQGPQCETEDSYSKNKTAR